MVRRDQPITVQRDAEKGDGWWKLGSKTENFDLDAIQEESKHMLLHDISHNSNDDDDDDMSNGEDQVRYFFLRSSLRDSDQ